MTFPFAGLWIEVSGRKAEEATPLSPSLTSALPSPLQWAPCSQPFVSRDTRREILSGHLTLQAEFGLKGYSPESNAKYVCLEPFQVLTDSWCWAHCFPVNPLCFPDTAQHSVPLKSTKNIYWKDLQQHGELCRQHSKGPPSSTVQALPFQPCIGKALSSPTWDTAALPELTALHRQP